MRSIFCVFLPLFLVGCASAGPKQSEESNRSVIVSFSGADNDAQPFEGLPQVDIEFKPTGKGARVVTFPLTYAIQCSSTQTNCKHAVVKTELRAHFEVTDKDRLSVDGALFTELGRSKSVVQELGTTTLSVPQGVPLIGRREVQKDVSSVLAHDESLTISGLAGVDVSIRY